jgi:HSP20 family molecular chaperone IbpA
LTDGDSDKDMHWQYTPKSGESPPMAFALTDKEDIMTENIKKAIIPMVEVNHNDSDSGLVIRVDLAGASKESVDLDVGERGFCVSAEGEDFRYENCYTLAHEIRFEEAGAKFQSGLLTVEVPFKEVRRGHKVSIQ